SENRTGWSGTLGNGKTFGGTSEDVRTVSAPATETARQWNGWGTALKPAHEPIVLGRKPLIGTVAENVLQHGTGGLNVDRCRVGTEELSYTSTFKRMIDNNIQQRYRPVTMKGSGGEIGKTVKGRFP